ncbi:MAG TPA: 2'-deoxycytidine 5'-triphosphate deaminase [Acidimicrobiales bacterium]|nr:2'-deoxycytidine 5'-triphosphate deaminase [Acidimicrobiales bacterium]
MPIHRFADLLGVDPGIDGVLPNQHLAEAIEAGVITSQGGSGIPTANVQPASLDLRLGPVAYRLRCSFLPDRHPVEARMRGLVMGEIDLTAGDAVLDKTRPYLIPLKERLALPPQVRARANPKSSTGRADVFTRVICDRSHRFDEVPSGYEGPLYLEVVPLSFAIRVREDLSLNQLRLSVGRARLADDELVDIQRREPLLLRGDEPVADRDFAVSDGLFLGLNLQGDRTGRVGYRAKPNAPLLDLTRAGDVDPEPYWEPVHKEVGNRVVLEPRDFYLLMSNEAVRIPPTLAAEMTAYDPTSGELRTHYAGFFDPGFGYDELGRFQGSTAALEVRAHDVAFMIEHRQPVCKLTFERMLEAPTQLYGQGIGSNYQRQSTTLGKHFAAPASDARKGPRPRRLPADNQLELPVAGDEQPSTVT